MTLFVPASLTLKRRESPKHPNPNTEGKSSAEILTIILTVNQYYFINCKYKHKHTSIYLI